MNVKDLMVPISDYLRPETKLQEAVKLLWTDKQGEERIDVKGIMPVLDSNGKLMGMLTMQDILKAVHPAYLDMMNRGDFTWDSIMEEMAKKAAGRTVEEVMARTILSVHEIDPLTECVDLMLKNCVKRLPVVDAAGNVVGMIYQRDIFAPWLKR